MKVSCSEFAQGFTLLGSMGLLVGVFVVPGQWLSSNVRPEAIWGIAASVVCVVAAVLLERSLRPAAIAGACVLFLGGVAYMAMIPFVAADVGLHHWQGIGLLALVALVATLVGWHGLQYVRSHGAQQVPPADAASPHG